MFFSNMLRLLFVVALVPVSTSFAQEGQNRALGAHEHGHGKMMIAQDELELLVELHLPGVDVVGFEHVPENHEQEHVVELALNNLKNASLWLRLTESAKCQIEDAHVSSPFAVGQDDHKDEGPQGAHGDHAHDSADKHDDSHDDEHADVIHSEFSGKYHFHCEAPDKLNEVDVGLFNLFPSLEEIDFQAVMTKGQYAGKLDAAQSRIRF
ncbi:MAG: DUF2796 domain-containing protein [Magnetovibrio sp.]|nr:DUF2796 domain-containing protein [Magnetovibrio sp.]